jgi:gamma-glutamyl:cysteine ligase YbdK (ATP-grasp superfamily)
MTREKLMQALKLAGLTEAQIDEALARLEWADKLPKIARALARLGVPYATITVVGNEWRAEVDGYTFQGTLTEATDEPTRQGKGKSGDSARAILRDLQARGVEVSEAALQYAAAYISRTKRLQEAIRAHPDLYERARKLGLLQ